ncbi:flavodoxin family protein [Sporomusa sp. KB1]|uniref:flavodoxin family protein n=1 Tax=Sporomusa sp. KB1 TaxID=943346 RepID=UPI0011A645A0|nr:flavodoxin family protein [Sporomusa sp. KB1]TWH46753.1 NADPH-dependent FMN reductase [Sporomusa sp. KB1]
MKKSILVVTGSPRVGGNSDLLADAFIKGAAKAGHEVVKCEAGRKNIMGCKACDTCYSKGKPCSFDDDFNSIAPLMEKADVIVFITPLYWFTFPTQLKALIDKTYSFIIGKKEQNIKESMLLVCGEEKDEAVFDGIITTYERIANYQKWTDRGQLIVPGVLNKGDVLSTNYLVLAEKMGHNI